MIAEPQGEATVGLLLSCFEGRRFTVAEMAGRRIARVRVETIAPQPTTGAP